MVLPFFDEELRRRLSQIESALGIGGGRKLQQWEAPLQANVLDYPSAPEGGGGGLTLDVLGRLLVFKSHGAFMRLRSSGQFVALRSALP